jgi:hypothetical protein
MLRNVREQLATLTGQPSPLPLLLEPEPEPERPQGMPALGSQPGRSVQMRPAVGRREYSCTGRGAAVHACVELTGRGARQHGAIVEASLADQRASLLQLLPEPVRLQYEKLAAEKTEASAPAGGFSGVPTPFAHSPACPTAERRGRGQDGLWNGCTAESEPPESWEVEVDEGEGSADARAAAFAGEDEEEASDVPCAPMDAVAPAGAGGLGEDLAELERDVVHWQVRRTPSRERVRGGRGGGDCVIWGHGTQAKLDSVQQLGSAAAGPPCAGCGTPGQWTKKCPQCPCRFCGKAPSPQSPPRARCEDGQLSALSHTTCGCRQTPFSHL